MHCWSQSVTVSNMSHPKERHYWAQLRTALTAGQWHSNTPAKSPNGVPLSWSELFRKFKKHCRGAHDVANVASSTHTLALLIAEDGDEHPCILPLDIDAECLVKKARLDQVKAAYDQLKSLQSSNLDVSILCSMIFLLTTLFNRQFISL